MDTRRISYYIFVTMAILLAAFIGYFVDWDNVELSDLYPFFIIFIIIGFLLWWYKNSLKG